MRTRTSRLVVALALAGGACARATTASTPGRTTAATTTTTSTTTTSPTTTSADAQPQTTATSLPAGPAILARFVQAVGGRDAITRRTTMRALGTFEMPVAGVKGQFDLLQVAPNKMAMTMTLPGMGQLVTGYDGTTAWSVNPMQGPRVVEGRELDQIRDEAGPQAMFRATDRIRSAETMELTSIGAQSCYRVKLTYHSGRETVDCYSTETGLLVASTQRQESSMGSVEITTIFGDWKDFGGITVPTKLRAQMMGQEMVQTIERVEFDRPEDAKAVEMPNEVKPLVRRPQ